MIYWHLVIPKQQTPHWYLQKQQVFLFSSNVQCVCYIFIKKIFFLDIVPNLPANWPRIAQLLERHSWNFSTAVSPSVNKAVSHLELLQTIIEEWFKEAESAASSRSSKKYALKQISQQSGIFWYFYLTISFLACLTSCILRVDCRLAILG